MKANDVLEIKLNKLRTIKGECIYSGKAKSVYATNDAEHVIIVYRDDATAFNGVKKEALDDKGRVNNLFNAFVMEKLEQAGIKTHFVQKLKETESLVKKLEMLPVECVVRNIAAGSICKRLGIEKGTRFERPVFEFFLKDDALGDPMINESHILSFGWANAGEIEMMKALTFKVNETLKALFAVANIDLVDYKLEFGRFHGELLLGDEVTPDGCRLWDKDTQEVFDKDRFRQDLGDVIGHYKQVARRIGLNL
ncbi:MAG: phosphoribosylaminoimidazolesuccinocarboxamide synthase [Francisellaceae bacterium]